MNDRPRPGPHHEPQGRARHSVRAVRRVSQPRRARSDTPYLYHAVQAFNAQIISGNSLPQERENCSRLALSAVRRRWSNSHPPAYELRTLSPLVSDGRGSG
jgi:hypothetical protein